MQFWNIVVVLGLVESSSNGIAQLVIDGKLGGTELLQQQRRKRGAQELKEATNICILLRHVYAEPKFVIKLLDYFDDCFMLTFY